MKHKLFYAMLALALITAAALLWNASYQVARFLGCDHALVDVASSVILAASFYPIGKFNDKEEMQHGAAE